MVDLSYVPHAELESDLVLHMHDEGEVLNELRSHFLVAKYAKPSIVEAREPVHCPKLDHKEAVDFFLYLLEELLLI